VNGATTETGSMKDYNEIPILHAFEEMLRDAFVASGETDVFDWLDGKTFSELVGNEVAQQFHDRDPEDFAFVRSIGDDFWQLHLNQASSEDKLAVCLEWEGLRPIPHGEFRFWAGDRSAKTWIDPAMKP
jgi:hypothetical protein